MPIQPIPVVHQSVSEPIYVYPELKFFQLVPNATCPLQAPDLQHLTDVSLGHKCSYKNVENNAGYHVKRQAIHSFSSRLSGNISNLFCHHQEPQRGLSSTPYAIITQSIFQTCSYKNVENKAGYHVQNNPYIQFNT